MLFEKCKYEFEQLKCTNGVEKNGNADEKKRSKMKIKRNDETLTQNPKYDEK